MTCNLWKVCLALYEACLTCTLRYEFVLGIWLIALRGVFDLYPSKDVARVLSQALRDVFFFKLYPMLGCLPDIWFTSLRGVFDLYIMI